MVLSPQRFQVEAVTTTFELPIRGSVAGSTHGWPSFRDVGAKL